MDLSFPQFVKYLFWGSTNNLGLFEISDNSLRDHDELSVKQGNQPSQLKDEAAELPMEFEDQQMFSEQSSDPQQQDSEHTAKLSDDSRKRSRHIRRAPK